MTVVTNAPPISDTAQAPEIFASYLAGASLDAPNIHLTFVSNRVDHSTMPPTMTNVVCERLVMSVPAAMHMVDFLQKFLANAQLGDIKKPEGAPMQ
ncbi:MAG TPA: hypothetical protein VF472_01205 [Burkholderiaceae bacterium]